MNIRETLNQKSGMVIGASAAIVALAVVVIVWQLLPEGRVPDKFAKMYFTTDDGKTYFADASTNVPPYMKDGKEAVRAQVVRCGRGKPFVGFLIRVNPEAKAKFEESKASGAEVSGGLDHTQTEHRKPGETEWHRWSSDGWSNAMVITCPDGSGSAMPVYP